jgi:hypothetical protein
MTNPIVVNFVDIDGGVMPCASYYGAVHLVTATFVQ